MERVTENLSIYLGSVTSTSEILLTNYQGDFIKTLSSGILEDFPSKDDKDFCMVVFWILVYEILKTRYFPRKQTNTKQNKNFTNIIFSPVLTLDHFIFLVRRSKSRVVKMIETHNITRQDTVGKRNSGSIYFIS